MKINMTLAAIIAATLLGATADSADSAAENYYLRLDSGWSHSRNADNKTIDSAIIGAGVGYRFNPNIRGDITLGYRGGYEVDRNRTIGESIPAHFQSDVSSIAGMANLYYDVGTFGKFTPYIGGGVGFSRNKVDRVAITSNVGVSGSLDGDTKTSVAWQFSAGTAIDIAPRWSIDVGYRYVDLGEARSGDKFTLNGTAFTGGRTKGDLKAHEIQVGLRYTF